MRVPLVSIVVPIYNVEKYVQNCIESILCQTYENLEILLIDDGSTDSSGLLSDAASKKDPRVNVIHKTNGGLSDARNVGISMSNGEYVSFIDGDDYVDKEFISTLLATVLESDADIAEIGYYKVYENGTKIYDQPQKGPILRTNIQAMRDILVPSGLCDVVVWNKLYKKDLFVKNKIRFPVGKYHEDAFTTYKLFFYSKQIIWVGKPLYFYVQRGSSIMGGGYSSKSFDYIEASNEVIAWVKKHNLPLQEEAEAYRVYASLFVLSKMNRADLSKDWEKIIQYISTNRVRLLRNKYVDGLQKIMLCLTLFGGHIYFGVGYFYLKFKTLRQQPAKPRSA